MEWKKSSSNQLGNVLTGFLIRSGLSKLIKAEGRKK